MEDNKNQGSYVRHLEESLRKAGPFGKLIDVPLSCLCIAYKCTFILRFCLIHAIDVALLHARIQKILSEGVQL